MRGDNLRKYFIENENKGVDNMEIKIKYVDDSAKRLEINEKGNFIDVYAYEDIFVPYMGYGMVHLGFAMELPKGKIAQLVPRSSTFKTWGVIQTNHCGIIDETYCGNEDYWRLPVQCTMAKETIKTKVEGQKVTMMGTWIRKGDKIAQFQIVDAMQMPTFVEVDDLGNEDRGGFGSTGSK